MGFNDSDTSVQFGIEEFANYNFLGVGLAEAKTWSLNITEFKVDNVTQYYSTEGFALLASQKPLMGIPEAIFYELDLWSYGFICPVNGTGCFTY